MSNNQKKFECALGIHEYTIPWEKDPLIKLCKHCKRFGYYKNPDVGLEVWYEFDNKGNDIHFKNSDGFERWTEYDKEGNEIYCKFSNGEELKFDKEGNTIYYKLSNGFKEWKANNGRWITRLPKDWKYEKYTTKCI